MRPERRDHLVWLAASVAADLGKAAGEPLSDERLQFIRDFIRRETYGGDESQFVMANLEIHVGAGRWLWLGDYMKERGIT